MRPLRLWVRLSLAFGSIVVLSTMLLLLISMVLFRPETVGPLIIRVPLPERELVAQLEQYAAEHPDWRGVQTFLGGVEQGWRGGPLAALRLTLLDSADRLLYTSPLSASARSVTPLLPPSVGAPLTVPLTSVASPLLHTQPLTQPLTLPITATLPPRDQRVYVIAVAGSVRGRLLIAGQPTFVPPAPAQQFLLSKLGAFALWIGVISGILGLIFGVLMSRHVAAPLQQLARTARQLGTRSGRAPVAVRGSREMRELAAAFNAMVADLEQLEQLRNNLIADVAHELRTPLSILQGNLRAILDNVYPLEQAEILRLYDQTRHLNRLVNDLHELTLAANQQLTLVRSSVDLNALVAEAVALVQPLAEMQAVQLTYSAAALPLIQADAARLTQVVHNLLSNALKHTPADGRIDVAVSAQSAGVCLRISDTGEGIAPEHLPYVFERFYRTDRARSRDTGGTGLGLAIARAMVEAHGGSISIASDPAQRPGTTITIVLPLDQG